MPWRIKLLHTGDMTAEWIGPNYASLADACDALERVRLGCPEGPFEESLRRLGARDSLSVDRGPDADPPRAPEPPVDEDFIQPS